MKDIEKIKKQMAFIQTRFLRFLEIASSADMAFLLSTACSIIVSLLSRCSSYTTLGPNLLYALYIYCFFCRGTDYLKHFFIMTSISALPITQPFRLL